MGVSVYPPITPQSVSLGGAQLDAFGRHRVSNPQTLFDSKQLFDSQALFWDDQQTSGGSTSTAHSTAEAATTISVGATTAGVRVRQTKMRFNYQPGKSQLIFMTFSEFDTATGITKRVGYFDGNDGLFFESAEGTLKVVRRTNVSGSPQDNGVAQSSWNIDKMDGTGVSGITLDASKTQIGVIDFEWLGTGRARMGFVVKGVIYYCHEFLNANVLTTVYMSKPNLPVRYEIRNDGNGAADDFVHICSTVISEGGSESLGYNLWASTSGTHVDCASENTIYAIVGIRLKSTHLAASVDVLNVELMEHSGTTTKYFEWLLMLNPTVASTFTYSSLGTYAVVDYATGATANTVTGGTALAGGFAVSANKGTAVLANIENELRLGSLIAGTPDEIVLCVRPIGGSTDIDIEGGINIRQIA